MFDSLHWRRHLFISQFHLHLVPISVDLTSSTSNSQSLDTSRHSSHYSSILSCNRPFLHQDSCTSILYAAMQSFHHIRVPSLSSLYTLDGRLPTLGSQDYSRIPRLRRHKWTAAEKQVLYLLNATYSNNNPPGELWTVFNAFFQEGRRPRRGWVGPRRTAWETMRVFIMDPVRYCPWWTGAEARRVRGEIERVAEGVGVRLLGKGPLTPVRGRGKRVLSGGRGSVSSVADDLHSVRSTSPEQGTVRRELFDADSAKRAAVTNGLLTPPPTVKKNGKWKSKSETDIPVPSIAFRGKQYYNRNTEISN